MNEHRHILISRTDSLGDVVLTLPVAGLLKKRFPGCRITLIGRAYTLPLARNCVHIDGFIDWNPWEQAGLSAQARLLRGQKADVLIHVLPRKDIGLAGFIAGIPLRIGTTGRWWHYLTCNRWVAFSRKRSDLHESLLNLKLLTPLGIHDSINIGDIQDYYGLKTPDSGEPEPFLSGSTRKKIILHPGSRGSAREWGMDHWEALPGLLDPETYEIFITGSAKEGEGLKESTLFSHAHVQNLCGNLSLEGLMALIGQCDVLVANSTGPLHIAAALGRGAVGIYPPIRPMHPGRWAPLGERARVLVLDKDCNKCRDELVCDCIRQILPEDVAQTIQSLCL